MKGGSSYSLTDVTNIKNDSQKALFTVGSNMAEVTIIYCFSLRLSAAPQTHGHRGQRDMVDLVLTVHNKPNSHKLLSSTETMTCYSRAMPRTDRTVTYLKILITQLNKA
ncbi:hypothetical protein D9C73_006609 [Collichthys lucidus]|uniref:Uncharacterized protein n=1 Tax=Collichthys lucidus TaxID=240159 RepID=A0A4U5UDH2_COLLU|nr:hypothetical protein D9C73_006609 [Collichthys lucidus]